ncbi:NADP(H)-dependent aldo-keto reductase [Neptunomonas antarctica]|uniref:Protein tas n=1 Tax=Neptunomonas antarctica TaxID=619304 RepID=A0A1N7MJN0_9GAMM|nr:NADP(H)-dependent aldo-keto reductase [Neptunomonas antarctica]SIS86240.1 Predicted oxidoreductase [Neptunomonas antarctica]
MHYRTLGNSDLKVSRICLGTMTFGNQNSEADAHQQLDYAISQGVNFFDLAEMYPVPTAAELQGRTEQYMGNWMRQRNNRDQLVIATKAAGPADMVSYLRPDICFDRRNIRAAIEGSLQRLQTEYIDLYQLHWPDRGTNFFGQLDYKHDASKDGTPIIETLKVLKELVDEGKIRYIGLSNESPWGVMTFLKYAEMYDLPRVISVQNPYSLLNRKDEIGLTEVLQREQVDLLAYSPLGFGVLSGKYLNDQRPEGARLTLFPSYARYIKPNGIVATQAYVTLAREHGLDPAQMALAYVNSRGFVGATIIGATTLAQLKINIDADSLVLSDDVVQSIEAIHESAPNPSP